MTALLEVALMATYQPSLIVKATKGAHYLGVGSAVKTGVDDGT